MNNLLARRVLALVLPEMAAILRAPGIRRLPVQVSVQEEATTAATSQTSRTVQIVLPTHFEGAPVESDTRLYLGLTAHEIGHLPALTETLAYVTQAHAEDGPALAALFNLVEDMRSESALLADPVNDWLARPRTLVREALPPVPETAWDLLSWLRFGNPSQPLNLGLPVALDAVLDQLWTACQGQTRRLSSADAERYARLQALRGFWSEALDIILEHLPQGVSGAFAAAQQLLARLRELGLALPEQPPEYLRVWGPGPGAAGTPAGKPPWASPLEAAPLVQVPDLSLSGLEWDAPDPGVLTAGRQIARRMTHWWTQSRTRHIAGGVGRYNPRLEGRGLPPFTLPLAQQPAPPPQLALFLDISDSMWSGEASLALARIATVALVESVVQAGGQVKVWAFWAAEQAVYLGRDLPRIISARGYGTTLTFLEDVVPQLHGDWSYLFITDAEIDDVPPLWTPAHRCATAVIYIPFRGDFSDRAAWLGERVITVQRAADLPLMTALAARRFFRGASRV